MNRILTLYLFLLLCGTASAQQIVKWDDLQTITDNARRTVYYEKGSKQPLQGEYRIIRGRRAFVYSRIPSLGFHRQWFRLFRLERRKSTVGMRICKHEFVRRFPASLLGRHFPAPPLCERCKVLSTTKEKHT